MKITDPDIIKNGEKDLIDAVKEDLDLDAVRRILEKRMAASSLTSSGGEIIVHNNEIAFRIDFNVKLSGSLMFDRAGNYIPRSEESGAIDAEDLEEDDLDLDDLDIGETLDEVGPDLGSDQESEQEEDHEKDREEIDDTFPGPADEMDDTTAGAVTSDMDDGDLDISLPDYALEDGDEDDPEPDADSIASEPPDTADIDDLPEDDLVPDLSDDMTEDLDPLEDDAGLSGELDPLDPVLEDAHDLGDEPEPPKDDDGDIVDDDIGDILKESREFWEQKKDS